MNPWNKDTLRFDFDTTHKDELIKFYKNVVSYPKAKRKQALVDTKRPTEETIKYLKSVYDDGYGLKVIAREIGLTYSRIRSLFVYLEIDIRRGYDISTSKTDEFRSARVKGNKNPWYDWTNRIPEMHASTSKGIQGYFKRKNGQFVWLRSTWEFIYAKWIDDKNINWEFEGEHFHLSSGESYRPDFSIFDDNGQLLYIVEVKGFFKNRMYKIDLMKKDYPNIKMIVIHDISKYCKNYHEELKIWKQERILLK